MRVIVETSWDIVYLCGFFSFVIYFQHAIFTTVMYTYMMKLDPLTTPTIFGVTITLHGIGNGIGALCAAYWTNRRYKSKKPLLTGFILFVISNLIFLLVDHTPTIIVVFQFMLSRFIGGLGMGNTATLRTTITAHSKLDDRAKAMSIFIGGRSLGLIVGPGLQFVFLLLGDQGIAIGDGFLSDWTIHSHNAAGFISIILNFCAILALFLFYEDIERNGSSCSMRSIEDDANYPKPDRIAGFICMLTRYAQVFTYYSIETLAPAFIMMMFNMERAEAVESMSILFFIAGIISLLFYLSFIFTDIARKLNIGKSNTLALIIFILYLLFTYQWNFFEENVEENKNGTQGGCDFSENHWCANLKKSSKFAFYVGYMLVFGGCTPFINVSDATLYSKLFNPVGQAIQQSFYDVSQIFARVVSPLLCTLVYSYFGPKRVWELLIVQLIIVLFFWVRFAHRMVPLRPKPRPIFYLE